MGRKGSCLCGALRYEVDGDFDGVWMCHCSNCRKTSGAMGNTILIVPRERFRWLSGEDHRVKYAVRPTYAITRCKTCGTPLPAEEDEQNVYLTAGTLDDPLDAGVKNHIFYGSRADWDRDAEGARYFVERSSGPQLGDEADVRATADAWADAIMRRDRDAADRILGAEYSLMAPGIGEMPRARWLESLPDYVVHSYEIITTKIQVHGQTAVQRSHYRQNATVFGEDRSGEMLITDVWVKRDDRWQVVARHTSFLPA